LEFDDGTYGRNTVPLRLVRKGERERSIFWMWENPFEFWVSKEAKEPLEWKGEGGSKYIVQIGISKTPRTGFAGYEIGSNRVGIAEGNKIMS